MNQGTYVGKPTTMIQERSTVIMRSGKWLVHGEQDTCRYHQSLVTDANHQDTLTNVRSMRSGINYEPS